MLIVILMICMVGLLAPTATAAVDVLWTVEVASADSQKPADFTFECTSSDPESGVEFFGPRFVKVGVETVVGAPATVRIPVGVTELVLRSAGTGSLLRVHISTSQSNAETEGSATGSVIHIQWDEAGGLERIRTGPPDARE